MVRRQRVLGVALILGLSVAGCAHAVSGEAGTAAIAPALSSSLLDAASSPPVFTRGSAPASSSPAVPSVAPTVSSAPPTVSSVAPPPTVKWSLPAPKTTPRKNNQFGNQIATVGQTYAMTYRDTQQTVLRFVVDSIKLDGRCDNTDKPTNGHFLIISLRVQLGAVTAAEAGDDGIGFTAGNWTAFDAKNVAQVGTDQIGAECLTTSAFPFTDQLDPGTLVSGRIALDVSATSGTVVLLNTIAGGWVYHYG